MLQTNGIEDSHEQQLMGVCILERECPSLGCSMYIGPPGCLNSRRTFSDF